MILPTALAVRSPALKWIPPYRREMPASFAASLKVFHCKVMGVDGVRPGSMLDEPWGKVTESPKPSLPVNSNRTSAPAALNALCPEMYSGNGGVGNVFF